MEAKFELCYGRAPRWIARAPGRVNLIGEHTDYNDGYVLPMAIERDTQIAAAPNGNGVITLRSTAFDDVAQIDLKRAIQSTRTNSWTNYVAGVIAGMLRAGHALPGLNVLIDSSVPLGAGLSSSASLEVALATLLEAVSGKALDPVRKAALCREAEHVYARVPCGIMDQYVCAMARADHLLLLDCASQAREWIGFSDPAVSLLIVDTGVKHELAASEYRMRRNECEQAARTLGVASLREADLGVLDAGAERMGPTLARRARHVITENGRTLQAADAFERGRWEEAGLLMYASHESLRQDFEVSCAELDAVVRAAAGIGLEGGVYGCRMTGGGFGGCAVALIAARDAESISQRIGAQYLAATGREARLFVSRPARGAQVRVV